MFLISSKTTLSLMGVLLDLMIFHQSSKNEVRYGDILFQRVLRHEKKLGRQMYIWMQKNHTFGGFVIRGRPLVDFNPVFFNAMLKTAKDSKRLVGVVVAPDIT